MWAQTRRRSLVSLSYAVARPKQAAARTLGELSLKNGASEALALTRGFHVSSVTTSQSTRTVLFRGPPEVPSLMTWQRQQARLYHNTVPTGQMPLKPPPTKRLIRARSSTSAAMSSPRQQTSIINKRIKTPRRQSPSMSSAQVSQRGNEYANNFDMESIEQLGKATATRSTNQTAHFADSEIHSSLVSEAIEGDEDEEIESQGTISVVEAFYAAKTIDLAPLIISELARDATRKKYNKDNLLLQLSSKSAQTTSNPSYVAVYRFGSVIFFNVSPRTQAQMLKVIKKHALEPLAPGFEQKDTFGVCVMPNAPGTKVTSEHCIVPSLNMNAVAVISEVMAQSVALESYNEIVDSLLEKFSVINSNISTTNKMDLDKKFLFSKIAQNNRIFIDLISKIRIKKRNQIAWDQGEYEIIHSGMTMEFDIDDRFELIQFKLDLIQQNSKLFLEVIQHQKSASLEWVIVVLIGFECVLMCLEMSGQGSVIFDYAKNALL